MGDLTLKQNRYVQNRVDGLSKGKAALAAGYTAKSNGYALEKQENIRGAILMALEKAGVSEDLIAEKMAEGFESLAPPKKDGGIQYPDYFTRKQYVDMALRVKGAYAPEELHIQQKVIHINITPDFAKGLVDAGVVEAEVLEELPNIGRDDAVEEKEEA